MTLIPNHENLYETSYSRFSLLRLIGCPWQNGLKYSYQLSKRKGQGTTILKNDAHPVYYAQTLFMCVPHLNIHILTLP